MTFEIGALGRSCFPWSVSFLDFRFLLFFACSKVFRKASLSQVLQLAKSAVVQYVTVVCLVLAKQLKHLSRPWDGALMWAVMSLWPQKVVYGSQMYSVRAKLTLISDQATELVENCFEGRPLCVPFKTARLHPASWINRLRVYMWWFMWGKRELLSESNFRPY